MKPWCLHTRSPTFYFCMATLHSIADRRKQQPVTRWSALLNAEAEPSNTTRPPTPVFFAAAQPRAHVCRVNYVFCCTPCDTLVPPRSERVTCKCSQHGRTSIVEALLGYSGTHSCFDCVAQRTCCRALLAAGGHASKSLTCGSNKGASAMLAAAFSGISECLEQLLAAAAMSMRAPKPSAVDIAAANGHADMVQQLLLLGATAQSSAAAAAAAAAWRFCSSLQL